MARPVGIVKIGLEGFGLLEEASSLSDATPSSPSSFSTSTSTSTSPCHSSSSKKRSYGLLSDNQKVWWHRNCWGIVKIGLEGFGLLEEAIRLKRRPPLYQTQLRHHHHQLQLQLQLPRHSSSSRKRSYGLLSGSQKVWWHRDCWFSDHCKSTTTTSSALWGSLSALYCLRILLI